MVERRLIAWLRPALALFGIAGILLLAGCGGGSGAPNNPYTPPPPVVGRSLLPAALTAYAGTPVTLTDRRRALPGVLHQRERTAVAATRIWRHDRRARQCEPRHHRPITVQDSVDPSARHGHVQPARSRERSRSRPTPTPPARRGQPCSGNRHGYGEGHRNGAALPGPR
jgi:hypothetical protein